MPSDQEYLSVTPCILEIGGQSALYGKIKSIYSNSIPVNNMTRAYYMAEPRRFHNRDRQYVLNEYR